MGTRLPGRLFPRCWPGFLPELPPGTLWRAPAAIKVADGWHAFRQPSDRLTVRRALYSRCGVARVDEIFSSQLGADSSVLWLRHYSVPLDGRGHYLQAWFGLHRCDCGCRRSLLRAGRLNRRNLSYAHQWSRWRNDCHRYRRVFVPAISGMDSGAVGPLFLPGPSRLPPHADRIRTHAYE